ncbi:enoyl-ACP reductase FabI [Lactiplantibacillus pentosus]|jgi:enoyl-[acyl-carrier protein] reductase I|uniref:Enoyl-[acyl-carrier-protein] reductase [NADH] n=1 Tax=Lactiplantibacillus pentosus TaxID=1589 RepID=A0AB37RIB0_LACPE|nr:enoyl-ACP reductase FabI [Lactiplantibacillus pentosus]MCH4129738.1 enoyl-ACP reductase FabI [Lactiplantibacillus sp.]BBM20158.1 enoyl-[acyl-carrier protein] reductase [Lactiplantibacillus plantarum]RMW41530.1 enoyl-[acyl-carrier-protein] reductase FabI [Lactiplantibacillus pentosus]RMW42782.1 enoyl-[acyl-carrier-protein] reductase FabI [Lactiplantibacillus pentosus]RMW53444.1 enoyl-[acyl-carrier-protein] reductase FabI [Lactiplantibacillus pentosus]
MDGILSGKTIVVMGVANQRSIAWGCTEALMAQGAQVILTYQNDRLKQSLQRFVAPEVPLIACDVADDDNIDQAFATIKQQYGALDGIIHAIAYADKATLEGDFVDTTKAGYDLAQNISAYSLIAIARAARPMLKPGASLVTLTYFGSERAVPNYNMMGVAKAALEANVRYLARDLGPQQIRVNAISAGAVKTLAVTGIHEHQQLLKLSRSMTVDGEPVKTREIGNVAAFLVSDLSTGMTGDVVYVDKGVHLS